MIRRSEAMKEWRILLSLEFEWRMFRFYRKLVNWLVRRGLKLSSPILCLVNNNLDNYGVSLARHRRSYENMTGEIIQYYKRDEF
jgi:hypothetical protein